MGPERELILGATSAAELGVSGTLGSALATELGWTDGGASTATLFVLGAALHARVGIAVTGAVVGRLNVRRALVGPTNEKLGGKTFFTRTQSYIIRTTLVII